MIVKDSRVVVVGAGLMGTGIAHAFASSGFATTLVDSNAEALARAQASIHAILEGGVKLGKLAPELADAAKARLSICEDLTVAAEGARLLVETVSENLAVKKAVLTEAATVLAPGAIIATNTSAFSVTEIAASVPAPERVIGMHFFNPVHKMKLVELVLGIATDAATVATSRAWCEAIGKTSILVNESPGLTTSRMSAMLGNEAMWMLQEGTASAEDIDTALRMGFTFRSSNTPLSGSENLLAARKSRIVSSISAADFGYICRATFCRSMRLSMASLEQRVMCWKSMFAVIRLPIYQAILH